MNYGKREVRVKIKRGVQKEIVNAFFLYLNFLDPKTRWNQRTRIFSLRHPYHGNALDFSDSPAFKDIVEEIIYPEEEQSIASHPEERGRELSAGMAIAAAGGC